MTKEEYAQAVEDAFRFAGAESAAWNGLFLLGLAIAGLKLIYLEPGTKIPTGYQRAPLPMLTEDWDRHDIIVPHDFDSSVLETQTIYD